MKSNVLLFCRDEGLGRELGQHLGEGAAVRRCHSLETLHEELKIASPGAVLVHLGKSTLNGYSAGRFIAELDEAVDAAPLYGLVDADCPPRLKKLADRAVDACLPLPLDYEELRLLLAHKDDPSLELEGFWRDLPHKELHGLSRSLVSFTPAMFEMIDELKVAARHEVTALLIGETGSGKTYLARLIHELSERRHERFCTVACGALPPDLLESELFGHIKGAFTSADANREGKFAAAGRGTLLLDEIDVLPLDAQTRLLRIIETGEYEAVGSNETRHSQARLIVASNYNLEDLVRAGSFRTDLYYRLNILHFRVPPLRERPRDIEYLARKFALEHSRAHKIQLREIEPEFLEALKRYPWPGNVRELENVIRRAVLYCQRGVLSPRDLSSAIRHGGPPALAPSLGAVQGLLGGPNPPQGEPPGAAAMFAALHLPHHAGGEAGHRSATDASPEAGNNWSSEGRAAGEMDAAALRGPGNSAAGSVGGASAATAVGNMPLALFAQAHGDSPVAPAEPPSHTLEARVDVLERRIIEECLRRNGQRRKETAAELGISRVTLYNKMKKFGLLD